MMDPARIAEMPEWLTPEEAARALNISARGVRKKALREGWLTKTTSVRGGQRVMIHRTALEPGPDKPPASQAGLIRFDAAPDWAQAKAEARRDLIVMIEERAKQGKKSKQRKAYLKKYARGEFALDLSERLNKTSYATYMRWLSAYKAEGIAGLLPAHKGRAPETAPDVLARLKALSLKKHRAAAVVHDMLAEEFPGRVPSYDTVLRHVKAVRAEYAEEMLFMHKGATAHRHATLTGLGRSDAKAKHPNHMWEIDGSPADVVDEGGVRRKVIGIVDIYTRRYLFRLHVDASALRVAQTLRAAILKWGLPDVLIMDNGKDYQAKRIQTMCEELGIHVITNPPFSPEKKPHVERSFRTLSRRVFKELTGSTGHDLNSRPEVIVPRYGMDKIQEIIDTWTENYWHERPLKLSGKFGKRPRELAGERAPNMVADERVLDVLLGDVGTRKIRQGFINYRARKYFHDRLLTLDAFSEVQLREDAADVGRIFVFVDGRYFCTALDLAHLGLTPEEFTLRQRKKISLAKARVRELKAEFGGGDPDADYLKYLDCLKNKKPTALPGPKKVVEFPGLEKAAQAVSGPAPVSGEPAPEAVAGGRPAFWDDPAARYEWCLRNPGLLETEDVDYMASYENTAEYRENREAWDCLRETLELAVMEGNS